MPALSGSSSGGHHWHWPSLEAQAYQIQTAALLQLLSDYVYEREQRRQEADRYRGELQRLYLGTRADVALQAREGVVGADGLYALVRRWVELDFVGVAGDLREHARDLSRGEERADALAALCSHFLRRLCELAPTDQGNIGHQDETWRDAMGLPHVRCARCGCDLDRQDDAALRDDTSRWTL